MKYWSFEGQGVELWTNNDRKGLRTTNVVFLSQTINGVYDSRGILKLKDRRILKLNVLWMLDAVYFAGSLVVPGHWPRMVCECTMFGKERLYSWQFETCIIK